MCNIILLKPSVLSLIKCVKWFVTNVGSLLMIVHRVGFVFLSVTEYVSCLNLVENHQCPVVKKPTRYFPL
jgi:hypothetical protein